MGGAGVAYPPPTVDWTGHWNYPWAGWGMQGGWAPTQFPQGAAPTSPPAASAPAVDVKSDAWEDAQKPSPGKKFRDSLFQGTNKIWTLRYVATVWAIALTAIESVKKIKGEQRNIVFSTREGRAQRKADWHPSSNPGNSVSIFELAKELNERFQGELKTAKGPERLRGFTVPNLMHVFFPLSYLLQKYAKAGLPHSEVANACGMVMRTWASGMGAKLAFDHAKNLFLHKGPHDFSLIQEAVAWLMNHESLGLSPKDMNPQLVSEKIDALKDEKNDKLNELYRGFLAKLPNQTDPKKQAKLQDIMKFHSVDYRDLYDPQDDPQGTGGAKTREDKMRQTLKNLLMDCVVSPQMRIRAAVVFTAQVLNLFAISGLEEKKPFGLPLFQWASWIVRWNFAYTRVVPPNWTPSTPTLDGGV